jgi:hypothetical protein
MQKPVLVSIKACSCGADQISWFVHESYWEMHPAFLWVGGGAAHVTPREVCEAGDWPPQGSPLLWPSWDREDPIGTCCCQSNRCLLYSCHWEWACPEVRWRRCSYGSWAIPGNAVPCLGLNIMGSSRPGRSCLIFMQYFQTPILADAFTSHPVYLTQEEIPLTICCLSVLS